LYVGHVVK
jgi:hypothetical protein